MRYLRNTLLDGFGDEGQKRLLQSKVFCVGAGGLGSPVLLYLVSSGVGKVTILEHDDLEITNLQRQVLYKTHDISKSKAELAKQALNELNPDVEIEIIREKNGEHNLNKIFEHDAFIDTTDSPPSRHITNQIALFNNKPFFSGAAGGYIGHVYSFFKNSGCYDCLFHPQGPWGANGVFAPLVGATGSLMASNLVMWLALGNDSSFGKMTVINARTNNTRVISFSPDPACHCQHII